MSRTRRPAPWLGQVKRWQLIAAFIVSSAALGSLVFGSAASIERNYGILAYHFGWARERTVVDALDDVRAWQLYSDIVKTKRRVADATRRKAPDEDLEELDGQLTNYQREYNRIIQKRQGQSSP